MVNGLRRQISLPGGTALAVGMVVGSGVFGLPGLALELGSPQIAALGWLACAIACLPLLCVFATLGTHYASAAGISRYAEAALGQRAEFAVTAVLCGTFPLTVPAQSMIGASYALVAFGLHKSAHFPVCVSILFVAVAFNLVGIRTAALVNQLSLGLIATAVLGLCVSRRADLHAGMLLWMRPNWTGVTLSQVWKVSALLFWAFIGWENVSFGLEEFRDPQRAIKHVYAISFVVVIVLYSLLAGTVNGAASNEPFVGAAEGVAHLVPRHWQAAFSLVTVGIIQATANAWVFAASRLFYSAGRNRLLPPVFARLGLDRRGTPRNAVLLVAVSFVAVLAAATVFHIKLSGLLTIANQNFVVLYLVCIFACWKTGRGAERWLLTPLALLSCCFLLADLNYRMCYPIALLTLGALCHCVREKRLLAGFAETHSPPLP
ncbi:APC family permease [Paraburkholderia sp. MMS20-SJTR3]|uniref:APC family permease n=1 Tax=Paraburkholderia sejongensis TaxID=2886946 RepID=A0ABS8JXS1_9BURK|nr:APC family permease [Paraburkholderia sp. MMS20-SJTR3]MCC8394688.1 APC family permease [Paraburkholderia sp. MMS20-SJTR3]